jgi:SAM-dependent methyltransferase
MPVKHFGFQWTEFPETQIKHRASYKDSVRRLIQNCGVPTDWFYGKNVLEVGCGAGRFTGILLELGAHVIAMDPTEAIHINKKNHPNQRISHVQADICEGPPFIAEADFVLCYGVIQHLKGRRRGVLNMLKALKNGGRFSMDTYEWRWRLDPYNFPKYLWRPITKHLPSKFLLKLIRMYLTAWYPIDTRIKSIPKYGKALSALTMIPCYSYPETSLSPEEKREWAILDTFDALGAEYDKPFTKKGWRRMWEGMPVRDLDIFRGGNGLIANGMKAP